MLPEIRDKLAVGFKFSIIATKIMFVGFVIAGYATHTHLKKTVTKNGSENNDADDADTADAESNE